MAPWESESIESRSRSFIKQALRHSFRITVPRQCTTRRSSPITATLEPRGLVLMTWRQSIQRFHMLRRKDCLGISPGMLLMMTIGYFLKKLMEGGSELLRIEASDRKKASQCA
ncbi:hypothetical protein NE237_026267 [Protea cynaroides]|uniref:Uncharacterized protein n=1 Tax=Protea cynaroides TaxID=273540 RepID=A0A9Q0H5T8_9MAGN|nr:hypothetical protein NE237_026267 [Protea cynaroides]